MKPLNPFTFLKRNPKKMLPVFCSVAIGVLLIYIFSLFSATTSKMVHVATFDLAEEYNIVYTKDDTLLPQKFEDKIKHPRIQEVLAVQMNLSGLAYYRGGMGGTTIITLNLFEEDTAKVLERFDVHLAEGRLPANNQKEILLPIEYALQNGLAVGDFIGTAISDEYALEGRYRICGLTNGKVLFSVSCQPGNKSREEVKSKGVMYSVDGLSTAERTSLAESLPPSVIAITSEYYQREFSPTLNSMKLLTYILTAVMILVLCIALGNLNIVLFASRRDEMTILGSIGYTNRQLAQKLWEENLFACVSGYLAGILLTIAILSTVNVAILVPHGKVLEVINVQGFAIAFALPVIVSVFSLLPIFYSKLHRQPEPQ